jgi:stress-induced morphogen
VYAALREELEAGLHALALVTQTPAEYAKRL